MLLVSCYTRDGGAGGSTSMWHNDSALDAALQYVMGSDFWRYIEVRNWQGKAVYIFQREASGWALTYLYAR